MHAALLIQKAWRKFKSIKSAKNKLNELREEKRRNDAALLIQAKFKSYSCRKKFLQEKESKMANDAAITIGRYYRGHRARYFILLYIISRIRQKYAEEKLLLQKEIEKRNIIIVQAYLHTYLWMKRANSALAAINEPSLRTDNSKRETRLQHLKEASEALIER